MKNALIVKYTPREGSNTQKLVDEVWEILQSNYSVQLLDLVTNPPEFLLEHNLNAYIKKHLCKKEIEEAEQQHLNHMEQLADQVIDSDLIVLAFPIYNFNMPAAIKAWIDSILIAGKTFRYTEYGPDGLLKGKKLLVVNTSDTTKPRGSKDYWSPYLKEIASFVGISDLKITGLYGIKYSGILPGRLEEFKNEVQKFIN
jgi:FMN-dependent NADH-azoreductase